MPILYPTRIEQNNLGDVLINSFLIRELSKHDTIFLDSSLPEDIYNLIIYNNEYASNIKVCDSYLGKYSNFPVIRWIGLLPSLKFITTVYTVPGHYFGGFSLKSLAQDLKNFLRVIFLSLLGIDVITIGVTIGPYSALRWQFQKIILSMQRLICVRDFENFLFLKSSGFKNIKLIDDISLLYEKNKVPSAVTTSCEYDDDYVVVSFRSSAVGSGFDKPYLDNISLSLTSMIETNSSLFDGKTLIFSFQVKEDFQACEYLFNFFSPRFKCRFVTVPLNLVSAAKMYSSACVVITNRLHVALLAILNGSASLILTDTRVHTKLVNVFKQLNIESLIYDIYGSDFTILKIDDIKKRYSFTIPERKRNLQCTIKAIAGPHF